jgi:phosphopantothenoylcysteine synthetase/decarboxylase
MTEAARHFITPVTMQSLTGKPVFTDQWDSRISNNMAHIDLTRHADAILIAPCSADFMRKLVHGAADDLLSTLCLARPSTVPLLVAPAMNVEMWQNPATQRNVDQLKQDGVSLCGPAAGEQACGETGLGRMLEPEQLLEMLLAFFQPKLFQSKNQKYNFRGELVKKFLFFLVILSLSIAVYDLKNSRIIVSISYQFCLIIVSGAIKLISVAVYVLKTVS